MKPPSHWADFGAPRACNSLANTPTLAMSGRRFLCDTLDLPGAKDGRLDVFILAYRSRWNEVRQGNRQRRGTHLQVMLLIPSNNGRMDLALLGAWSNKALHARRALDGFREGMQRTGAPLFSRLVTLSLLEESETFGSGADTSTVPLMSILDPTQHGRWASKEEQSTLLRAFKAEVTETGWLDYRGEVSS